MLSRVLAVFLLFAACVCAQQKMGVAQLKSVLRSSIRLNHNDKQVAEYIRKIQLTERLTHRDVEELFHEGLGPRAAEELRKLVAATASLPPPVKDPAPVKPVPLPPPSSVEQARVISEAREMAPGLEMFALVDTVAERLSYFEQKEEYKLISVNGKWTDADRWKLGGATSSGEFGTMLREIFELATETEFQWERWGKLRGRICHVYSFRVRQAKSKWHISWQRQLEIVPGYRGLIYIDRDVPIVLRVTMEAVDIPPSFPIQEARTMLDYDFVDIAGNDYLLPLRSEMRMREGRLLVKNQVEFRSYRKFGAEAIITFDPNLEPIPEEKLQEEKVEPGATGGVKPPRR
jgi:hypothetical protein